LPYFYACEYAKEVTTKMKLAVCSAISIVLACSICLPVCAEAPSLPVDMPPGNQTVDLGQLDSTADHFGSDNRIVTSDGLSSLRSEPSTTHQVPEPSGLVLALSGLAGAGLLSLMAWRRQLK
jgi:hypothetical protein